MKSKTLLSQLTRLEQTLHDFSFDELTSEEAVSLQKSFNTFKNKLEDKIFDPQGTTEKEILEDKSALNSDANFQVNKKETRLIAHVSHEIRTPLNGIIGFTDLLKEDEDMNQQQIERVHAIQKASYSLLEIINELLDYAKLSSGLESFEKVNFDFRTVIGDVSYLAKTLISDKNIAFNATIDDSIPTALIGDPSKLSQVLLNLLGNAIKFVKQGNIGFHIKSLKKDNKQVLIGFDVIDTGIGISKAHLEHIFDSYKQADSSTFAKYGGTGLGLPIVKQIIENLNGNIKVTSDLGQGTTFNFEIPFEIGNDQVIAKKTNNKISKEQLHKVKGLHVLVFEDNLLNQKLIEERLKSWHCNVYITEDANQGLKILQNQKIDLILMDLKMPNKNGFEVTQMIRNQKDRRISQTPVIALSADFSSSDKENCLKHKISDFILKPYGTGDLINKLIKNKENVESTQIAESSAINPNANDDMNSKKIDLAPMLDECMGEIGLLEDLVQLFIKNAQEFMTVGIVHIQNNNVEQLEFAAHKIKSGLKMMHCEGLLNIIHKIQEECKDAADFNQLKNLYEHFIADYPSIEFEIVKAINHLKNK